MRLSFWPSLLNRIKLLNYNFCVTFVPLVLLVQKKIEAWPKHFKQPNSIVGNHLGRSWIPKNK